MKKLTYILLALLLCSCATTKNAPIRQRHTAEVKKASLTLKTDKDAFTLHAAMQTVLDSACIISVQPIAGIELIQIRATHDSVTIIDRTSKRFARVGYDLLTELSNRKICYKEIESIATGAHLRNSQKQLKTQLELTGHKAELTITYPRIDLDEPLRLRPERTEGYQMLSADEIDQIFKK